MGADQASARKPNRGPDPALLVIIVGTVINALTAVAMMALMMIEGQRAEEAGLDPSTPLAGKLAFFPVTAGAACFAAWLLVAAGQRKVGAWLIWAALPYALWLAMQL